MQEPENDFRPEDLQKMQARGGDWFVYVCNQFDSVHFGGRVCLQCGVGCTHEIPPPHLPNCDAGHGQIPGHHFLLAGKLDLSTGKIQERLP